uniref:OAR domain-containing protein n=1 Tax=Hymenolepis diminuta TaxID=6216 RepID=A0A0R3SV43_HYMDI
LSGYSGAATQSSVSSSGGGSDFWRGGGDSTQGTNLSNLKQPTSNLPSSTTNPPTQSTPNSTSLYAAVMAAAAVASWGGQAMPTPTPATNSLAPSALVKTASSAATTEAEAMARRNKSMDANEPVLFNDFLSCSMFAAAAAAHMHFLSAAAAAASFTNNLPASVPSTNPDSSTTTMSGVQQRGSVSGSSPLSNARITSSGLTQKSFDLNRQNAPL